MMPTPTSGDFSNAPEGLPHVTGYLVSPSSGYGSSYSSSLLFYLTVLKEKFNELQNLVGVNCPLQHTLHNLPNSMAVSNMNSTIQEIILAANSMMVSLGSTTPGTNTTTFTDQQLHQQHQSNSDNNYRSVLSSSNICHDNIREHSFFSNIEADELDWFAESYDDKNNSNSTSNITYNDNDGCIGELLSRDETDIIEFDAADLLASYTHFCDVCGKGFKRDANLRMHMRAHGDEYKTTEALSNPMKNKGIMSMKSIKKKYSCPQEGCRWNKKHAKFQPLKSMICVKNHYKRTHCPKIYVCKMCNLKQFSVLSDLKTHEKHCGDPKWECLCGNTFSRKDKLMGHVALFVGLSSYTGKLEHECILH
ncbi:hypothetical protein TanjilG_03210 [Lupinus angustifolius]|uniref:C2H2-type domain-containing protein n=1 Tax=Lupinus angustifolius TaxID=3871 RepID=A0A4P1RD28_LUPAN|nr:PREDICTED: protein SENSITIVE TO PROTON RHIZOTOXICITY 1-like [Lupinus angustifolius]OIW08534.1 hypothetical protein TanjilG_03210 [Lupinus angustifolius]